MNKWKQTKKEQSMLDKLIERLLNNSTSGGMFEYINEEYEIACYLTITMALISIAFIVFEMLKAY